jgi:hypothetical protein
MTTKKTKLSEAERAAARAAEHPARPEQYVEGFQTGYDQARDTPDELRGPNFARGIAEEAPPGPQPQGRFSEGMEQTSTTAAKQTERRFSEGIEKGSKGK